MAKRIAWWVSYFAGVIIFILVGCEIFLRFLIPNPQGYFVYPPHSVYRFVPDPETTPGVEGVSHFVANSLGMRADEIPPDAKRRILVFGGSTGIDVYLDQKNEMWTHQVQNKLNATPKQPKAWVGNVARPGLTTIDNLLEFDLMLPNLPHMNMFVNLVGVNDFQLALQSSYWRAPTLGDHLIATFSIMPKKGWRNLALYRFYERIKYWWKGSHGRFVQTENAKNFAKWLHCRQTAPKENLVDLPNLDDGPANYRLHLNKLVDRSEVYYAPMIFLTQPTLWNANMTPENEALLQAGGVGPRRDWCTKKIYYSPAALARGMKMFNDVLRDVCRRRKIYCIDLAARVPKERRYFFDAMHYSEAGARLVSDVVTAGIIDYRAWVAHNSAH